MDSKSFFRPFILELIPFEGNNIENSKKCLQSIFNGIFNDYNGQVAAEIELTCSPPIYSPAIEISFVIYETINYVLILFGIVWFGTILLVGWQIISNRFIDTFSVEVNENSINSSKRSMNVNEKSLLIT